MNRLAREKSPYLLQHAGNPVDWRPWGPEAFEAAKREDKPVFLSIGYSTCHWCHVMERESFVDEEVARLLNARFIPVKVDREERPDVDALYMSVCIGMTGSGGWPLTVFLAPDQRPFYAGTYFPKTSRSGRPGLMELLQGVSDAWTKDRENVLKSAQEIADFAAAQSPFAPGTEMDAETLRRAFEQLAGRADSRNGGFGGAPKFPTPHNLSFLLRWWKRNGEERALEIVEKTLDAMAAGGIHDQLGGGFHRYSTDAEWGVPHFEKMLYDQALLAIAYVEAHQATAKRHYAAVARETFDYVLRDMTAPEGGFHSAEDADSEGLEGKFYVWRPEEVKSVLGEKEGDRFCRFYDITGTGNFHEPHGPQGHSIPRILTPLAAFAKSGETPPDALEQWMAEARGKLLAVRNERVRPHKDDKILTDWNGLMIAALAKGVRGLGEPRYAEAARHAADFILTKLRRADGRLLHRWRDGEAAVPGYLDDYAFLAWGLLELYEATFEVRWLKESLDLARGMLALFPNERDGGFYLAGADAEPLIARTAEVYDGAVPSGNSAAALVLLRLSRMTGDPAWERQAGRLLRAISGPVGSAPVQHSQMMIALDFALGPSREIVVAGRPGAPDTEALVAAIRAGFSPRQVVLLHPEGGAEAPQVEAIAPFVKARKPSGGKAAAYVCADFACQAPVTDPKALVELLK